LVSLAPLRIILKTGDAFAIHAVAFFETSQCVDSPKAAQLVLQRRKLNSL
jgi:hypothetical protein